MSWGKGFENPAVLAASVASLTTLCITLVTAGSAVWSAHIQTAAAKEKIALDTKRELLVEAFRAMPPGQKVLAFIQSGALNDDDCKIRTAMATLNFVSSPDCNSAPRTTPVN